MIVVSPKPNRIISTGTSAESGALTKMLTQMPSRFVGDLDPAHQHAERHADDDRQAHADDEAAQRDQRRRLPGCLSARDRTAATSTLESGGMQEDQVEPADDFPDHAPDDQAMPSSGTR